MKIAIIADSAPPLSMGGVSSAHYMLYSILRKQGFNIRLFTFSDYNGNTETDEQTIVRSSISFYIQKIIKAFIKLFFMLKNRKEVACQTSFIFFYVHGMPLLNKKLRNFEPDILFVPDYCAPMLWISVPKTCHVIEIEHHNPERFTSALLHHAPISLYDVAIAKKLQQHALKKVDTVVCPSQYMLDFFKKNYAFSGNITKIFNPVDLDTINSIVPVSVVAKLSAPRDSKVVYIPSGGTTVKGERYVFSIIQRICSMQDDVLFFISGAISATLQEELSTGTLGNKVFTPGYLPHKDTLALAKSCTICVSPTLAENCSMALIEALACGLPIAAFDVGGNRDIIDTSTGILCPYLDMEALSLAAATLLTQVQRSQELVKNAQIKASAIAKDAEDGFLSLIAQIQHGGVSE